MLHFLLEMYEVTSWRQCQSVYAHLSSWIFNLTTNVISFISLGGIIRQTTTLRLLRSWDFTGEIPGSRPVTKLGPNCCHYWGNLGQFTGQRKLMKIGSHLLHEHKKVTSESCSVKSCEPHLQLSASTWPPRTLTQLGKLDYNFNTQAAYISTCSHFHPEKHSWKFNIFWTIELTLCGSLWKDSPSGKDRSLDSKFWPRGYDLPIAGRWLAARWLPSEASGSNAMETSLKYSLYEAMKILLNGTLKPADLRYFGGISNLYLMIS